MSRTLQKVLLVAAVASAPSVALASPDRADPPAQPSFFQRILEKVRTQAAARPETPPANPADPQTTAAPPRSLPELPRWLETFFGIHDDRTSGT